MMLYLWWFRPNLEVYRTLETTREMVIGALDRCRGPKVRKKGLDFGPFWALFGHLWAPTASLCPYHHLSGGLQGSMHLQIGSKPQEIHHHGHYLVVGASRGAKNGAKWPEAPFLET